MLRTTNGPIIGATGSPSEPRSLSRMVIALAAMFLQQMFASVGKVLPAVLAPLVIAELHADPAWVGVYYGISAAADNRRGTESG